MDTVFIDAYNEVREFFGHEILLKSERSYSLINNFLGEAIKIDDAILIVYNGINLFSSLPSPKAIAESINGGTLKQALLQWGLIMEGWDKLQTINYRGSVEEFSTHSGINFTSEHVLKILGFQKASSWTKLIASKDDFIAYYQELL